MLGSGGHAKVLAEAISLSGLVIDIVVSPTEEALSTVFDNAIQHYDDNDVLSYSPNDVLLVNGIGSLPKNNLRADIYHFFKLKGYSFLSVIHPSAIVSESASLAEGVQIMASCVINFDVSVGENSIINTGSIIDHDSSIGQNCHIAPGVVISGGVTILNECHLGTGCSVIHSIKIGEKTVIGSGVAVNKNVAGNSIVYPARNFVTER